MFCNLLLCLWRNKTFYGYCFVELVDGVGGGWQSSGSPWRRASSANRLWQRRPSKVTRYDWQLAPPHSAGKNKRGYFHPPRKMHYSLFTSDPAKSFREGYEYITRGLEKNRVVHTPPVKIQNTLNSPAMGVG